MIYNGIINLCDLLCEFIDTCCKISHIECAIYDMKWKRQSIYKEEMKNIIDAASRLSRVIYNNLANKSFTDYLFCKLLLNFRKNL